MSLTTCKICGRTLTWGEINYNERIERRKQSSEFMCAKCGNKDFKQKLEEVKKRLNGDK